MRTWFLVGVLLVACKKGQKNELPKQQPETPARSGDASTGAVAEPTNAASWSMSTNAVALDCGEKPLELPAAASATAGKERGLPRADTVGGCQAQPSVEALCECLVKSSSTWASAHGLSEHVECAPEKPVAPDAQMLSVSSKPDDADSTSAGQALVFAAKDAGGWSARVVVESAPDVDLSVTPKASHTAIVDRVDTKAIAGGNAFLITSHNEAQDKAMGESEREGEANATLCIADSAKGAWCSKPMPLGAWSYTYTASRGDEPDACTTTSITLYSATVDPSGLTLTLEHGADKDGLAGRYTY